MTSPSRKQSEIPVSSHRGTENTPGNRPSFGDDRPVASTTSLSPPSEYQYHREVSGHHPELFDSIGYPNQPTSTVVQPYIPGVGKVVPSFGTIGNIYPSQYAHRPRPILIQPPDTEWHEAGRTLNPLNHAPKFEASPHTYQQQPSIPNMQISQHTMAPMPKKQDNNVVGQRVKVGTGATEVRDDSEGRRIGGNSPIKSIDTSSSRGKSGSKGHGEGPKVTQSKQPVPLKEAEGVESPVSRSMDDGSSDSDSGMSSEDPLLNPTGYLQSLKKLREDVFYNSGLKQHGSSTHSASRTLGDVFPTSARPSKIEGTEQRRVSHRFELSNSLFHLLENLSESLKNLRTAGFCGTFFSVLVLDRAHSTIAKLVPIPIADVVALKDLFELIAIDILDYHGLDAYFQSLTYACLHLCYRSGIGDLDQRSAEHVWIATVYFLDLALLTYVGAHVEDIGEVYLGAPKASFDIPGPFTPDMVPPMSNLLRMRKRRLQCLHQFLGQGPVWVFESSTEPLSYQTLILSTDVETLADVWGPLWKIKSHEGLEYISRYDIGNGFIVPWPDEENTGLATLGDDTRNLGVFCHWIANRDWDETAVKQKQNALRKKLFSKKDRLLIGAGVNNRLLVNADCMMSLERKLKLKQELYNKGDLDPVGARRSRLEPGSQSFLVQASAAGFATIGANFEFKRDGCNRKDILMQYWRNGRRNIQYLEMWGGVEVSLCTGNARRRQLLHILRSPGLRRYLSAISFRWIDDECERAYFEALRDHQSFRSFWRAHPRWRQNVGDAIYECFLALEETGVDERDDALSVLWIESFEDDQDDDSGCAFTSEENLVMMRRSEHSWTGLLKDSPECLTMAAVVETCLDFEDSYGYGVRCQQTSCDGDRRTSSRFVGYSVLQTAIMVNDYLLDEVRLLYHEPSSGDQKGKACVDERDHAKPKCKPSRRERPHSTDIDTDLQDMYGDVYRAWTGQWDVSNLGQCCQFRLGSHGYLKVLAEGKSKRLPYPVLMEWKPLLNAVGKEIKVNIRERMLGKSGELHHSEYLSGVYARPPLPCFILSKNEKKCRKVVDCS